MTNSKKIHDVFKIDFIENIDHDSRLLGSDTDSSYNLLKLPFNKFNDVYETVNYSQHFAKNLNKKYLNFLNVLLKERAGLNPKYNFMSFKSEVIAVRGFFLKKKFYALAKIWDEGVFFNELKLKKTGGQILKSDTTFITLNLLQEIYHNIVLNTKIKDKIQLEKLIFEEIVQKYKARLINNINIFNLKDFVIPKKWPISLKKTVPMPVKGARLYNTLFEDNLRPGESVTLLQIKININLLYKYISEKYNVKAKSNFQIDLEDVNQKLNVIAFPAMEFNDNEIEKIKKLFDELDIKIDFDKIIDFNVNKKIEPFKLLFKPK